ncbi:MAG: ATP-dependent RNA helicase HrpA [Lysobacteraceae bacterium]
MCRDQRRLRRLLSHWRQSGSDADLAAFRQAAEESVATRRRRAAALPVATFDEALPVSREASRIVELIRRHPVLVIAGETGSGKTTQLPKLCLAAGRGAAGMIGCTQPRRIAARSMARRVAEELGVSAGGVVGYQVRFTEQVGEDTAIKFMTDGILLAEIQSDRMLSRYDTIILDEAHERSLNIDFLLGYLKDLLRRRRDLKLIVTSATIDTARFARHFDDAPMLEVSGRSHPVEVRWRPPQLALGNDEAAASRSDNDHDPMTRHIVAAVDEITAEDPRGDVLVFLPGERDIHDAHRALSRRQYRHTEVLPLYARLSARDQDRVFNPGPQRRIVLATNVAETSLTVPRIRYVVDPGLARVKRYSARQKLDRLHIEPISRASADQRKGRCGRVGPGICYRLYDEADYLARPAYTDPEIRRSALAGVILRMLSLGLGRIDDFAFLDPPDPRAVADGWQQLAELAAVDNERKLSAVGRQMSRLPIDVKLARMLVAASASGCLREVLLIASFLGIQDPRERPADARQAADTAHAHWADPKSDFQAILNLWADYHEAHGELTQSKLRDWCGKRFLSHLRMREWRELHRQLLLLADELGWSLSTQAADYPTLHRALIAGMPTQIGRKDEKRQYEGPRQRRFALFPGSKLAEQPPNWILSATLLDTRRVYGLTNARIEPEWVIAEAAHLLARKHYDPRWSRSQGRVVGSEQISLFGLVLAPRRPIHYGSLYPAEAREIFVRDALVSGEINLRADFVARNLKTLEAAREEEAKLRRSGLVADEDWQARWYLERLPEGVHDAAALDAWHRRADAPTRKSLCWSLDDLLPGELSEQQRFPQHFVLGDVRLPLHYRFEPGAVDDGVTLGLPLHLLNALDAARLSWLVPGLVEERATELIRSLPKTLRRAFVPAPNFARAFREACPAPTADALEDELARFLSRVTGAPLAATDFDPAALPTHLRLNLRLFARDGRRVLAESRDLAELRAQFGEQADRAFAAEAAQGLARGGLRAFPDAALPESIRGEAGISAHPALVDEGDGVAVQVFADAETARREHAAGVRRLLRLTLADRLRQAARQLPIKPKTALLYAALEEFSARRDADAASTADPLRADLIESALRSTLDRPLHGIRDADAFADLQREVGAALFGIAMKRLGEAEAILDLIAELRPALTPPVMGFARANLDDLSRQLGHLAPPGFLRSTPPERLADLPRYLRGMRLRAQRLLEDPSRDQTRMLEVVPFEQALDAARAAGRLDQPGWDELRWGVEELRISLFAQELGTRGSVSPKRLGRLLAALASADGKAG